jgi:hypothetical protein
MSNSYAIAAVTATLRDLLSRANQPLPLDPTSDPDLADATCTTRPPDKARTSEDANQLNLFLYQTAPNAALRNASMPNQAKNGEIANAPLAINLFYLLTAYGRNFDDVLGHRLLGRAMSILHDKTLLQPIDIDKALPGNDLSRQIERLRIIPHQLTPEELSKLWTIFQSPYRLTTAYQVSVVLIDSSKRTKSALPVLQRGPDGTGNDAVPSAIPPYPTLTDLGLPTDLQPSARAPYTPPPPPPPIPGDTIRLVGHDLAALSTVARFSHPL